MLPLNLFGKHFACKFGVNTVCKECRKPLSKATWSRTSAEYRMWNRAKFRAKEKGLPFNLVIDDIEIPEFCPVLGVPFIEGDPDYTTSLDRLIPEKGYVKGNVMVMTNKANRMKSNATKEEVVKLLKFMEGVL